MTDRYTDADLVALQACSTDLRGMGGAAVVVATLATELRRVMAERDWCRLALLCEQGRAHDPETGEALPWTVAGWEPGEGSWWDLPKHRRGATGLSGIIAAHKALDLPPLEGVPDAPEGET